MNPAFSVVFFTTLVGAAQGLVVTLAVLTLAGSPMPQGFLEVGLVTALSLSVAGLVASFGHLGRPERAWRAALMWRTSWLSREVIVLPAFIAAVAVWWAVLRPDGAAAPTAWALLALLLACVLWVCTAMIYACLRFIAEWAHPLTTVNFVGVGLSSGLLLATMLAVADGAADLALRLAPAAGMTTIAAGLTRWLAVRRNVALVPRSTLQSATGIQAPVLRQTSMGMSAGAFNTREFFHGASRLALMQVRRLCFGAGFVLPCVLVAGAVLSGQAGWLVLAWLVQLPGLIAERWFFFAQARHPQNLYYQVVS